MASAATVEPDFLLARRERGAALSQTLELPQFKGRAGWEFTDISSLDLGAFAPAPAERDGTDVRPIALFHPGGAVELRQVDAGGDERAQRPSRTASSSARSSKPPVSTPSSCNGTSAPSSPRTTSSWLATMRAFTAARSSTCPRAWRSSIRSSLTAIQRAPGTELHRRTLVVIEDGAQAEVWEQHLSGADDLEGVFNTVVELVVGANANLRYVCGQDLSERSWVFGTQRAEVARDGHLDWVALGFGSAGGRVRMETRLGGQGADARVTGAYASHARQHIDFDTTQEHAAPNTTSDLAFRGVLQGRSSAVWKGNIIVDPGAQKTDAFQESRNLLLSKRAHADAIPGLEIQANDVRCTHAAAIAQVDAEQLFYLRSRGLREPAAKRLVIEGFLAALVERFEAGAVREVLGEAIERRLSAILD